MVHPLFDAPMPSETDPAPYPPDPRGADLRPAPLPGEHSTDLSRGSRLWRDDDDRAVLIADGRCYSA